VWFHVHGHATPFATSLSGVLLALVCLCVFAMLVYSLRQSIVQMSRCSVSSSTVTSIGVEAVSRSFLSCFYVVGSRGRLCIDFRRHGRGTRWLTTWGPPPGQILGRYRWYTSLNGIVHMRRRSRRCLHRYNTRASSVRGLIWFNRQPWEATRMYIRTLTLFNSAPFKSSIRGCGCW
jgi:hypothetical protein